MKKRAKGQSILQSASTTRVTRPPSKKGNSTASFPMRKRKLTATYAWLMKVVRTTDIRRTGSFVSRFLALWSELY